MKNPVIEKNLDDALVVWEYVESFPMKDIDEKLSLRNQARFEPLHEEWVSRYTEAMQRGDEFPALMGTKTRGGSVVLLDGNHRFQAKKRVGETETDIYIVTASPEVLQVLTFAANAVHGMPPSVEERTRHAIYLIDNGMEHKAAAAATGLLTSQVTTAYALEKADRRARQLGVTRGWSRLTKGQRERLGSISNDAAFVAATKLVVDSRLTMMESNKLCSALRNIRNERAQLVHIDEVKESLRQKNTDTAGVTRMAPVMDKRRLLIPHISFVAQMDIEGVVNATITRQQIDDLNRRIDDAKAALELLAEQIAKRQVTT